MRGVAGETGERSGMGTSFMDIIDFESLLRWTSGCQSAVEVEGGVQTGERKEGRGGM